MMTLDEFIDRARARGVQLKTSRVGSGIVTLDQEGGPWVPVYGLRRDEVLDSEMVEFLCDSLGLERVDFEL